MCASVRRRGKNVDSSSKSNPLRTSSGKKLRRVDVKAYIGVVVEKNEESRRTLNKSSRDLLTANRTQKFCVCYTKQINNLTSKQNYESKTVDVSMM